MAHWTTKTEHLKCGYSCRTGYVAPVTHGQMKAGETLVEHGAAGGIGAAAIQIGKALGGRVIAVAHGQ